MQFQLDTFQILQLLTTSLSVSFTIISFFFPKKKFFPNHISFLLDVLANWRFENQRSCSFHFSWSSFFKLFIWRTVQVSQPSPYLNITMIIISTEGALRRPMTCNKCRAMPCHAMPCHAMPCHAMPCYAMPCHALLRHAMQCYAMLCHAMLRNAMQCYAMLCKKSLVSARAT